MQIIKSFFILVLFGFFTSATLAQLDPVQYQGPSPGSVASGVLQTTDNFSRSSGNPNLNEIISPIEVEDPVYEDELMNWDESLLPEYVYVEDPNATKNPITNPENTVLLRSFPSIQATGFIPPDPHLAVGPNHIIATVNSEFSIYDKDGNELKNIDAGQWFQPVTAFQRGDPQVIYDHYASRWVIQFMEQNDAAQVAGNLIAISDDDNPLGDWYIYRMDTRSHGSNPPSNTWGDYPQMGYDDEAIYIVTRLFGFSSGFFGCKIRIINKSELYAGTGGQVTWNDIWDIRDPGSTATVPDGIHPVNSYNPNEDGWFFWALRSGVRDFYISYKITDPLTSPVLTGRRIPVQQYNTAPNANQLGGGTLIEVNGSHIKTSPVIRDGFLYGAHSIRNTTNTAYGSARYFKYNLSTNLIDEVGELGASGYFYIYPTITVDQDHNLAVTFSRSADTEYAGAYYSSKLAADPPGLQASQPMAEGQGNYVVTGSGTRNRWGDYLGICIDPDLKSAWLLSEYAASTNSWGTWISEIRMIPFSGVYAYTSTPSIEFGNIEVGTTSDIITAILANYGDQDLVIDAIPSSMGDFNLDVSGITFPITLSSYDSLSLDFTFSPTMADSVQETFLVTSNDPVFTEFTLSGHGYVINPAGDKLMYASSGPQNDGNLLYVDRQTGAGANIGPSFHNDILSLTISPINDELLGVKSTPSESQILRVNSLGGDAYLLYTLDLGNMVAIAFDTTGTLYGAMETGEIYSIDLSNGTYQLVSTAQIELTAITFEPSTNNLWASISGGFGVPKDQIFKIDLMTGDTTLVGQTGFSNISTNDLAFDENGVLYGIKGSGPTVSDLFTININTGEGTLVGSVGLMALTGLAFAETGFVVSVDGSDDKTIPTEFSLSQNYPNPFNPETTIKFSIPISSFVTLKLYDVIGNEVKTLVNNQKSAGQYEVTLNASDLSSGIYFYKLEVGSFVETKKMVLLK
jgi:hypothetical protein